MSIPDTLVRLGKPLSIEFLDGTEYRPGRGAILACDVSGKELFVFWPAPSRTAKKTETKTVKKGESIYRKFTGWEVNNFKSLKIPEVNFKFYKHVGNIIYSSDKWGKAGKTHRYIHTFENITKCFNRSAKSPGVLKIVGKIKVTEKGIEG